MLSSIAEIADFSLDSSAKIASFWISWLLWILLFLYFIICWYQIWKAHPNLQEDKQYYFTEFFNGIKDSTYARMFPAVFMLQRIVWWVLLIVFIDASVMIKLPALTLFHVLSLLYFLWVRPFKSIKDLLLELVSQMLVTTFTGTLIFFNKLVEIKCKYYI